MAEYTALDKHACPACGAAAEWTPSKLALVCPYCGTEAPGEIDSETGKVREIDLVQALRELPEESRGWATPRRAVRCRSCNAVSTFSPERVAQNCEFCGSPELVDYDEIKAPIRPEGLLPFKIPESQVRENLRRWLKGRWFAPSGFARRALIDRVRGVYLPYWTFDARAHCPWTAQAGHYYYTTETYVDSKGHSRQRQVRHVRWVPASGTIDRAFDDEPVPATTGVDLKLLRAVEPFPTADVVRYDTGFLAGFVVEHYQVVLFEAAQRARQSMDDQLRQLCAAQVPGDTYRALAIYPEYSGRTFKHVLVPAWLLLYDHRGKRYQILVNGHTGKISGHYPKSGWKIFLAILAGSTLVATIATIVAMSN